MSNVASPGNADEERSNHSPAFLFAKTSNRQASASGHAYHACSFSRFNNGAGMSEKEYGTRAGCPTLAALLFLPLGWEPSIPNQP